MSENNQLLFNEPRWADTSVADVDKAKRFYTDLFGWQFQDMFHEDKLVYTMAHASPGSEDSGMLAGIGPQWDEESVYSLQAWYMHLLVENVDSKVAEIQKAGGVVTMPPMDVVDAGRMAVCLDSVGAGMVLWQAYTDDGASIMKRPGTIAWFELLTNQPEKALEFYQNTCGWTAQKVPKEGVDYWMFFLGEKMVAGMQANGSPAEDNIWLVYFCTSDINGALETCSAEGGSILAGPVNEPSIGDYAIVRDNQGMLFGLVQFNDQTCN